MGALSLITHVLPFVLVAFQAPAGGQAAHEELRLTLTRTLSKLDAPCAYELRYATYEVVPDSDLGAEVSRLLNADTAPSVDLDQLEQHLSRAAAAIGKPVSEQLRDVGTQAIPEHAARTGMLVGGRPMVFDFRRSPTCLAQSCISDPNYFSIVRTPEADFTYFAGESRLEVTPRDDDVQIFTQAECCFPLPVATRQVSAFVAKDWDVEERKDSSIAIRAAIGGRDASRMIVVLGGPGGRLPVYCALRSATAGPQHALVAALRWKAAPAGETATLESAWHVSQSPKSLSVVHSRFENRRPAPSDDECVLRVRNLGSVFDRRVEPLRRLVPGKLPPEVAKRVVAAD